MTMETGVAEHFLALPEELFFFNQQMSTDFLGEIVITNDRFETELWSSPKSIMCGNCNQNFEDLNKVKAHLFVNPYCFFFLTKKYWCKNSDKKHFCRVCDKKMLDELMLKQHCFDSELCRKVYIDCYSTAVTHNAKPMLESNLVNAIEDSSTCTVSFKCISNSVDPTTTHMSEMSKKQPHSTTLRAAQETFQDENNNHLKKVKRALSMLSEVVDKMQNVPALTQTDNLLQHEDIHQPITNTEVISGQNELGLCGTSASNVTLGLSDSDYMRRSLPLKYQKIAERSQYDDKKCESVKKYGQQLAKGNKGKDQARSEMGQSLIKTFPLSCVCCNHNFTSEEEKRNHFLISPLCHLFLRNSFLDGRFSNATLICNNYTLNINMCPFCMFTIDDGDIIYHVMNAIKCRNKLEEAIASYTQSGKSPTTQDELLPTLSCICCGYKFRSQEEKRDHFSFCQLFFRNKFLDGEYLNYPQICDNYSLNKNLCPFCLFTIDDGDVVCHVLNVIKCRNTLEEAIARYNGQGITLPNQHEPAPQREPTPQQEPQQQRRFKCNICNRSFKTKSALKGHKTKNHRGYAVSRHNTQDIQSPNQHRPAAQQEPQQKGFKCNICNRRFKTKSALKGHKTKNHRGYAVSRHNTQDIQSPNQHRPAPQCEPAPRCEPAPQQVPQQQRFKYKIYNRWYTQIRPFKAHKTRKHSGYSKSSHQQEKAEEHCPDSDHLFCFFCKKFLRSQGEVISHQCRPSRLLSGYWYKKAIWAETEYQCTFCSGKCFDQENDLEKHMYTHEKKTRQLFEFVPSCSNQTEITSQMFEFVPSSSSNQTEMPHVDGLDLNNNKSSIICHIDNCDIVLETADEDSSAEFIVDVKHKDTRLGYNSGESNKNTFSESSLQNKPLRNFACENCNINFSSPDGFKAHVMMNSGCLSFYEKNQVPKLPVILSFCFKCKLNFRSGSKFINHQCVGLVSIVYQCALCPSVFNCRTSLSKHENSTHSIQMELENSTHNIRMELENSSHNIRMELEHVEEVQTFNDNEMCVDESTVYKCNPCQSTFPDSSQFVEHILQVHENTRLQ